MSGQVEKVTDFFKHVFGKEKKFQMGNDKETYKFTLVTPKEIKQQQKKQKQQKQQQKQESM